MLGRVAQVSPSVNGKRASGMTPDARVAELAATQHRVVSTAQLRVCGLERGAVQRRVKRGWLHEIHPGVYAVGHRDIGRSGFLTAAVLACGPGAVLSHRTAAHHWGLIRTS